MPILDVTHHVILRRVRTRTRLRCVPGQLPLCVCVCIVSRRPRVCVRLTAPVLCVLVPACVCVCAQLMRVIEFRVEGYSDSISLARGVYRTGRIITAAGIIMAIAFGALLFSDTPALNQLAFFLSFAVLFDTFVIRSVVVPAMMGLLGSWNWWPRKLPPPITTAR